MDSVLEEYSELVLPDRRLTERVKTFVSSAWTSPAASLPKMLQDSARLEGAYRLLSNERVSFEALRQPHRDRTARRAREQGSVVVVHDTTDVQTAYADPEEVGYLNTGKSGYRAHVSLAMCVEPDRPARPLGVLAAEALFSPNPPSDKKTKKKPLTRQQMVHSKEKASLRWHRGVEASAEALEGCPSVVHVADREADDYTLFCKILQLNQDFVIRLRNDRTARETDDETLDADWSLLRTIATEMTGEFCRMVPLSKRGAKGITVRAKTHPPREARCAKLHYGASQVELKRPRNLPADEYPSSLHLWLVRVWEDEPPTGEAPVEWLLLTSEPCEEAAEIARVVDIYRSRWMIEDFFKALKTGCALEERQLESRHALLNLFALFLPIAVHLLWLRSCARDMPDVPASEVLTPLQLTVIRHRSHRKMPDNPTAAQALWALAGMGGHIANNGWPGWQVLGRAFVTLAEGLPLWEAAWAAATAAAEAAQM
jgi:Transposase DNA-binding/Transposase DDE domain